MCKYCITQATWNSDDIPCEYYTEVARKRQEQYLITRIVIGGIRENAQESND